MEVALPRTATVVSKEDEDGFRATRDAFLLHSPIRLPLVTEYLFFYFCRGRSAELGQVSDLYKSQYRPLRKGLMNMVRLQMSGTMALPTGTRLQVMASSKDVIHS
jgi:heme/copper-type cytochrome/quinol oxidase subunit 2